MARKSGIQRRTAGTLLQTELDPAGMWECGKSLPVSAGIRDATYTIHGARRSVARHSHRSPVSELKALEKANQRLKKDNL